MARPSFAAALSRGGVWTRIVVNASDVLAMGEAPDSLRVYVERHVVDDYRIAFRLEAQGGQWDWAPRDPEPGVGAFESCDPESVVALYPFWGELAERHVQEIQDYHDAHNAGRSVADCVGRDTRGLLCNRCAFDAGGAYAWDGAPSRCVAGRCPLCDGSPRWLYEPRHWEGLPDETLESVLAAGRGPAPGADATEIAIRATGLGPSHLVALAVIEALEPGRSRLFHVFDASAYGDGGLGGSTRLRVTRDGSGEGFAAVMEREGWKSGSLGWLLDDRGWIEELEGLSAGEVLLYLRFLEVSARSLAAGFLADHGPRREAA